MSIDTTHRIEEDVKTAEEAFLAGRPIPPEVGERLDERTAEIRQRIFEKHGYINSVDLLRECREANH